MEQLSRKGEKVLRLLVEILPTVTPGKPLTYITYGKAHAALSLPGTPQDLEFQGLGELAHFSRTRGLPAITGLVIRQDTLSPGKGYFDVYGRDAFDFGWWQEQMVLSKEFDWSPYLVEAPPPTTPVANDVAKPGRIETNVSRILRDTDLARSIKRLHNYHCQICGETIVLANGEQYAEAHHVQPLGSPHDGPDVKGNIICVCPNHHVELDYFARAIVGDELRTVPGHELDPDFVWYHNSHHQKLLR